MTHITAVGALDLGPVLRPRAFLREVACLLTVAAGDCIGITRLIALLGDVVFGAAVAAGAGRAGFNVRAVAREVSHLVALAALDILSGLRLRAVAGVVAILSAVLAAEAVDAVLRTVASAMSDFLTVDTRDGRHDVLTLRDLLLAVLANVTEFSAVRAKRDAEILNVAARSKTLHVLLSRFRPTVGHLLPARLVGQLNGEDVLAARVTDEVNDGVVLLNLLPHSNEVNAVVVFTKSLLDGGKIELVVQRAGISPQSHTEDVQVLGARGINNLGPGLIRVKLGDAIEVLNTAVGAVGSFVTGLLAEFALGLGAVAG